MERFTEKYTINTATGCWEWAGAKDKHGYGRFYNDGRNAMAHRVSFELKTGITLNKEQHIMHSCDNPCCVNPAHLSIGDHKANMRDMASKGRAYHPSGEANGRAKINETQARIIRRIQGMSLQAIGDLFGLSYKAVHYIRIGKRWAYLEQGKTKNNKSIAQSTPFLRRQEAG